MQWQGKGMRNLGRCSLGGLAVELRQPDSTQVQPSRCALACVKSLLDFTMMAQYPSHTPETIIYGRICDAVPPDEGHLLGVSHLQTDAREG